LQLFEVLFLLLLTVSIARLVLGPIHPRFNYSTIALVGLALIVLGVTLEGWRWQMIPAYAGFGVLLLGSLKRSVSKRVWRVLGAVPILLLLGASAFLTHQLPILRLPAPAGPYGVGTFDYSITDTSRPERYAPDRNRELYVEVWYPADTGVEGEYPVRTLYQELYEGSYDRWSFFLEYMRHIPTHSHSQAPLAAPDNGSFPVLLFNHGGSAFTSQNQLLMEHLASHGYVIFSIAHPYQSVKVNLANAGTVNLASEQPSDIDFRVDGMDLSLMGKIIQESKSMKKSMEVVSAMRLLLYRLADQYAAQQESSKRAFLTTAIAMEELQPYRHLITEDMLGDYLLFVDSYRAPDMQYWVDDIQFIADTIPDLDAPVAGFTESLDTSGFGVFGMSYGGAAAGEFCKVDHRCKAGANLDGTQFGSHWAQRVAVPFLMFYHEEHQGGNDYAYLPPSHDFWDYAVRGSMHADFVDVTYTHPLFKTLGYAGTIDGLRMREIVNTVVLNFFDHYLKGKPISGELYTDIPEIVVRRHEIAAEPKDAEKK